MCLFCTALYCTRLVVVCAFKHAAFVGWKGKLAENIELGFHDEGALLSVNCAVMGVCPKVSSNVAFRSSPLSTGLPRSLITHLMEPDGFQPVSFVLTECYVLSVILNQATLSYQPASLFLVTLFYISFLFMGFSFNCTCSSNLSHCNCCIDHFSGVRMQKCPCTVISEHIKEFLVVEIDLQPSAVYLKNHNITLVCKS